MPLGDGTGPMGMGPMTGRAAGYCAGYPMPGFMNPYGGRMGAGAGWGMGRGFPGYYAGWGGYQPYMANMRGGPIYSGFGRGRGRGKGRRW